MLNQLKTIGLMGALAALVVGVGALVAPGYLYLFAALALAMNFGAYFFSDRIVLRMHGAVEITPGEAPELHALVAQLAARAKLPMPRIYLIPEAQPNAFATGRNPAHGVVAVTEGLLRLVDRRELRGVIAHELAHIKHRDVLVSTLAAVAAAVITYVAQALSFSTLFGGNADDEEGSSPFGALLVALVAPLAATLIQLGISRSREYHADATAAELTGEPTALARALMKLEQGVAYLPAQSSPATASLFIVNPFDAIESVSRWFSTHPSTADRVERLLAMDAGRPSWVRRGPTSRLVRDW
ncbi:MAG: zinc metalloprotease HtpX [Polyangiaceae bacterium]|nr:zinc metalloprotease HtpX [Polyangiaceae bacterium]